MVPAFCPTSPPAEVKSNSPVPLAVDVTLPEARLLVMVEPGPFDPTRPPANENRPLIVTLPHADEFVIVPTMGFVPCDTVLSDQSADEGVGAAGDRAAGGRIRDGSEIAAGQAAGEYWRLTGAVRR